MTLQSRLLAAFETHNAHEIQAVLDEGLNPHLPIDGKPPVMSLIEMYYRSDAFPACLRCLLDRGVTVDDPLILPVLLDDVTALEAAKAAHPGYLDHRVHLPCAFTSLEGVTLLHLAAEYGNARAMSWLLAQGCDPDARAETDEFGFNGHTPLFHVVNSNANRSAGLIQVLLNHGARPDIRTEGLWWGKGCDWETVFFDVSPVSFAQMGLLPQVHRRETDIYANIRALLLAAGRPVPELRNVPNRYLSS